MRYFPSNGIIRYMNRKALYLKFLNDKLNPDGEPDRKGDPIGKETWKKAKVAI